MLSSSQAVCSQKYRSLTHWPPVCCTCRQKLLHDVAVQIESSFKWRAVLICNHVLVLVWDAAEFFTCRWLIHIAAFSDISFWSHAVPSKTGKLKIATGSAGSKVYWHIGTRMRSIVVDVRLAVISLKIWFYSIMQYVTLSMTSTKSLLAGYSADRFCWIFNLLYASLHPLLLYDSFNFRDSAGDYYVK